MTTETIQVSGVRCERCVCRLGTALQGQDGLEAASANLMGEVTLTWDEARTSRDELVAALSKAGFPPRGLMSDTDTEGRRIANEARERVRFEEEALGLSDQVYRVARGLVSSREEAEDLVQQTYERAFRSWQVVHAGHQPARLAAPDPHEPEHRPRPPAPAPARHAADGGRRLLPLQQARGRSAGASPEEERVVERFSQDDVVGALSAVPHDFRDVLVLVDIGDFSYQDAAQILDIPIGTVMSRLHRARRVLKQELADRAVEARDRIPATTAKRSCSRTSTDALRGGAGGRRAHLGTCPGAPSASASRRSSAATSASRATSRCRPALKAKLAELRTPLCF